MDAFSDGLKPDSIDDSIIQEAMHQLQNSPAGAGGENSPHRLTLLACLRLIMSLRQDLGQRDHREKELLSLLKDAQKANKELKHLSTIDGLTQVGNRRHFSQILETEWKRAARQQSVLSLLMIDVDFFKRYNDVYGHSMGDRCLRQIAQTLASVFKRPADHVCRYGGEEFAILLPDTDFNGALKVAEEARIRVEDLRLVHSASPVGPAVSVSIGVSTGHPQVEDSAERLVLVADRALYLAKQEGRNRVRGSSQIEAAASEDASAGWVVPWGVGKSV